VRSTIVIPLAMVLNEAAQYQALADAFGDTPFGRRAQQRANELRSAQRLCAL
jgi:hypothetical protein